MLYTIISFLGLLIGYILATKTKEELNDGKKYFNVIAYSMLTLAIIVLLLNLKFFNIEFIIALIFGVLVNYFVRKIYLFLGLGLAIIKSELLGFIIFIFGLAYGTLEYMNFKKVNYSLILVNFLLFIIPIVALLNTYTMIFDTVLIGFVIGGIISGSYRINSGFKEEKRAKRHR